jgi:hypothetical protein
MKLLIAIFLLISVRSEAQILVDPYVQGEFRNDVVYVGSYDSPGTCTFNDGTDFTFDFTQLILPDGMEFVLVIDEPAPSNTLMMNGWATVNVGDSTSFTPTTAGLGITAVSNAATLNFHVRAIGTPITSGQEYTCGIDGASTEALCGNIYSMYPMPTLLPCYVSAAVGISEAEELETEITVSNGDLTITTEENGSLTILGLDGRTHFKKNIQGGFTHLGLSHLSKGNYIVRFETSNGTKSQKIALQ